MKPVKMYIFFVLMLFVLSIFACGGGSGGGGSEQIIYAGTITINENTHEVVFNLRDNGSIMGVIVDHNLFANEMGKVCYNSDPDGWLTDATACGDFVWDGSKTARVTVTNTSNNSEKGNWTLIDKSGKVYWFNVGNWDRNGRGIEYIPSVKDSLGNIDGPYVKYGKPIKPIISIKKTGDFATMTVDFGINKFDWMSKRFVVENLIGFTFRSEKTGWDSSCWAKGVLSNDSDGDWIIIISGLPLGEVYGNIAADLSGGTTSWVAPELWSYGDNIGIAKDPANANVWLIRYVL